MRWMSFVLAAFLVAGVGCSDKGKKSTEVKGDGDKVLKLTVPGEVTLKQNDTQKLKVEVTKKEFDEAIDVRISDLPEGVTVDDKSPTIAKGDNKVEVTLKADAKANPKKGHKAKVTVKGGKMEATESVTVNIEEKK